MYRTHQLMRWNHWKSLTGNKVWKRKLKSSTKVLEKKVLQKKNCVQILKTKFFNEKKSNINIFFYEVEK